MMTRSVLMDMHSNCGVIEDCSGRHGWMGNEQNWVLDLATSYVNKQH